MTSSDTAELVLAVPVAVVCLHLVLGAILAAIILAMWEDPPAPSRWAKQATVISVVLAVAAGVVLAVRLVLLVTDAGGYDFNDDYHKAAFTGLVALPLVVVTNAVAWGLARRRRANAADFLNRHLTDWVGGVLVVGVLAGPSLVLLAFFPF